MRLKPAGADDEADVQKLEVDAQDGLRDFEADDLMDNVREQLERLREKLIETHALPNCDVSKMFGVSESEWGEAAQRSRRRHGRKPVTWAATAAARPPARRRGASSPPR